MRDRPSLNPSVKNRPGPSLSYAQLLRAIGQAVDAVGLNCFELYNIGAEYILVPKRSAPTKIIALATKLWGRSLDSSKRRLLDLGRLPITTSDIDRLDREGRSRRGRAYRTANLSLSLRTLGYYLDEKQAVTFSISWSPEFVIVQYQTPNGNHVLQDFTTQSLYDRGVHELGLKMYLRRRYNPNRR